MHVLKPSQRHRLRMINPKYPAFNIYSHVAKITTALGPVCVATAVNEMPKWDVEVIDENNMRRFGPTDDQGYADHQLLQKQRPADVVGLYGGLTSTIPRVYEIAKFYKACGAVVIAGGQHFIGQNIDEALRQDIDYVVIGEGEEAIKEILAALEQGTDLDQVSGIAYLKDNEVVLTPARQLITDFDLMPLPDFSLVRYAQIKMYPVGRIRGCGMDCEFCTVKGKPRCASPERLFDLISLLVETRSARHFFIVDDLFGQQRPEAIRLCQMLEQYQKDIGLRIDLTAQIRLDMAKDTELLASMRKAGINTVAIGFESPIKEELIAMKKHIKPEDMIKLARVYHDFGFLVHGMFIFGYPMKNGAPFTMPVKQRIKEFRWFIKQAKIDTVQVMIPVPLPGTELRKRLVDQNRVYDTANVGWEYYDGNFPLFEPDFPLTPQDLQDSAHAIMGKFYQFKYGVILGLHIFTFPAMVFFLHDIKVGWRKWYRPWRNNLIRISGWAIMQGWKQAFKKGSFAQKLQQGQTGLKKNTPAK